MQDQDDKKYVKLLEEKVQKLGKDLSVLKTALLKVSNEKEFLQWDY